MHQDCSLDGRKQHSTNGLRSWQQTRQITGLLHARALPDWRKADKGLRSGRTSTQERCGPPAHAQGKARTSTVPLVTVTNEVFRGARVRKT